MHAHQCRWVRHDSKCGFRLTTGDWLRQLPEAVHESCQSRLDTLLSARDMFQLECLASDCLQVHIPAIGSR
ncbi:MAG: hypothetical protein U9Q35_14445, partial [Pseudomonadota bacterium]|nr:hypothetical protein [Pseudomonadota bacterium]